VQVPNTRYKPKTAIPDVRTVSATAFLNHARAVTKQYGAVAGVNLVNQHGTEGKLGDAFASLVESLPPEIPFSLFAFDFHKECGAANYQCAATCPVLPSLDCRDLKYSPTPFLRTPDLSQRPVTTEGVTCTIMQRAEAKRGLSCLAQ
jgi:hypothetical protein